MILSQGDVVLVSHRRLFPQDEVRFFLGRLLAQEGALMRIEGYSIVRDLSNGTFLRKDEKRTKILSLNSPGFIVYQLDSGISVDEARIINREGDVLLAQGTRELMNLSERSHCGHF